MIIPLRTQTVLHRAEELQRQFDDEHQYPIAKNRLDMWSVGEVAEEFEALLKTEIILRKLTTEFQAKVYRPFETRLQGFAGAVAMGNRSQDLQMLMQMKQEVEAMNINDLHVPDDIKELAQRSRAKREAERQQRLAETEAQHQAEAVPNVNENQNQF